MQNEIWKTIIDFEPYEVSSLGNIRRKASYKRTSSKCTNIRTFKSRGYEMVDLSVNGKRFRKTVHQLVARAFLENFNYGDIVNHIDGNKSNNCISNLEKSSYAQNNTHAYQTGLKPVNGKTTLYRGVAVTYSSYKRKDGSLWKRQYFKACITINGKKITIKQYKTELEAALAYDAYIDTHKITTHSKNFA